MVFEWIALSLIVAGVVLFGLEIAHPGALLLIPAFMLIAAGLLALAFSDSLLATLPGVGAVVAAAIFAAIIEIPYYRYIAPTHRPMTTTTGGLAGQIGVVTAAVEPNTLRGKVRVQREIWSAQSDRPIPEGTRVRIVAGEGVAVQVVPIEGNPYGELTSMVDYTIAAFVLVIFVVAMVIILNRMLYQIAPYQQGIVIVLGSYRKLINPGFNVVTPLATVTKMDLRTQVLEVPRQEVITKDNSPTNVDAIIYIKVVDAPKAIFAVQDYHVATVALAQTTLRSIIGDMELDEILYNRERINTRLRDILDEATDRWGVRVEAVEIKEVDPVGPVKAAMEEQTSAERQRRAAVLRADGEKRSAILVAEGQKRSRILQAEGVRQSKILEAEGGRTATILEAQGESQRLRILALGASTLDAKSLTVLSLDTITAMGNGQSTKILFPFEFSRLVEGAAEYLGTSRSVPDRNLNSIDDLEKAVGSIDDILGPIPKQMELLSEIKSIEDEIKAESEESTAMVAPGARVKDTEPVLPAPEEIIPPVPASPTRNASPPVPPPPAPGASTDTKRRPASPP